MQTTACVVLLQLEGGQETLSIMALSCSLYELSGAECQHCNVLFMLDSKQACVSVRLPQGVCFWSLLTSVWKAQLVCRVQLRIKATLPLPCWGGSKAATTGMSNLPLRSGSALVGCVIVLIYQTCSSELVLHAWSKADKVSCEESPHRGWC